MTQQELSYLIRQIKKLIPSKKIKISHDTMFGMVEVTYVDRSPKVQSQYQLLKKLFQSVGYNISYKGKSFSFQYKTMDEISKELQQEHLRLLNQLIQLI